MSYVPHEYARGVVDGDIVAGEHVRNACRRHLSDLERKDLFFSEETVQYVVDFMQRLVLPNGANFLLLPWQVFVVESLFGWYYVEDSKEKGGYKAGERRFQKAYIEGAKGCGKSPLAGAIGLYKLVADGDVSVDGYCVANDAEQARVTFKYARDFVLKSEHLHKDTAMPEWCVEIKGGTQFRELIHIGSGNSLHKESGGETKHGPKPNFVHMDELHQAGPIKQEMVNAWMMACKGRPNSLTLITTNSGTDVVHSICGQWRMSAVKAAGDREGGDRMFGLVFGLDKDDEPFVDEDCWVKANPSLEYSDLGLVSYQTVRDHIKDYSGVSDKMAEVERFHFCRWVKSSDAWIAGDLWDECMEREVLDPPPGTKVYLGIDLSERTDLCGAAAVWEIDGVLYGKVHAWMPEGEVHTQSERDAQPYRAWVKNGFIQATPGGYVNYSYIAEWIRQQYAKYDNVVGIAFDLYRMILLKEKLVLEHGMEVDTHHRSDIWLVAHPQGPTPSKYYPHRKREAAFELKMHNSMDYVQGKVLDEKLAVEFSPVLKYATSNAAVKWGERLTSRYLEKQVRGAKIDVLVAFVMAAGLLDAAREFDTGGPQVYF